MAIRCTIGGLVKVLEGTYKFDDTVDLRSTLEFTVHDPTGMVVYQVGQLVTLDDDVNGFTFSGYVNDAKATNITPNDDNLFDVTCTDETALAARRYSYKDYENQFGGDIAVDLVENYLAQDGVTGAYAIRRDTNQADFGQGTLSGTVGANNVGDGDLELALAGSTVVASDGAILPSSVSAIKLTGYSSQGYNTNSVYVQIWSGSQSISSGDSLSYNIWIDGTSPEIKAGVEFTCTDGTVFSTSGLAGTDGQGLSSAPSTDLSGLANDQWYARGFGVSGTLIGKTIASVQVALGGSSEGTYTVYFNTIQWLNGATVKQNFFSSSATSLSSNVIVKNSGYSSVVASAITAYINGSSNASHSVDAAKIVKASLISWAIGQLGDTSIATADAGVITVKTSIDGGVTFQTATNNAPIPNLLAGMSIAGLSVQYEQFRNLGKDPSATNHLTGVTITVDSAYQATKSDVKTSYQTQANFNTGTLSNTVAPSGGGVTLNGFSRAFSSTNDYNGVTTLFGNSTPADVLYLQSLEVRSGSGTDAKVRCDFAGNWQNFTAEVSVQIVTASTMAGGIVYRTTNWGNNDNTYAYAAMVFGNQVELSRASNTTGTGTKTVIATVTVSLATNSWHVIGVAVSGSTHQVYLDGVLLISATDSTYTATGGIGLRYYNNTGSYANTHFKNFGVCAALSGTWTSPAIPLTSAANYGNGMVQWDDTQIPTTAAISMQTSIDGGSTFQSVTNGGSISGLTSGQSLSGKTLILKATLSAGQASALPTMPGLTAWIVGQYSSTGTRIAPALPFENVGIAGSTYCSWDGVEPANCTLAVATSIDNGTSWQTVGSGASGSATISGITTQPDPIDDTFDSNSSTNYTQTQITTPASWTWDTTNSRLLATGGNGAILKYTGLSFTDGDTMVDLDEADGSGPLARVSGTTMYALVLYDSQASTHQNTFFLYAIVSGIYTQIATGSITFNRGTPCRFHLITDGSTITATIDGNTLASVTDSHIVNPGTCGIMSGALTRAYQLRIQQYGEDVSGLSVLTKATMTSADPTATPQLTDLTLSAYGPDIQPGALIPKANYSVLSGSTNTIAADLDDLAKQCDNFIWDINKYLKFIFRKRTANPSPWIATGNDIQIATAPQVENISDLYRNVQLASNGTDIQPLSKTFTGDGETQTWTLDYPVDALTSVTINNVTTYTIGVKGVDTGRDFYYSVGSPVISQDSSENSLVSTQSVTFAYNAQVTIASELRNDAAIAARAAVDGTTGVVQNVVDGTGLSKVAMLQKMQGLLQQYAVDGRTFTFLTMRPGLASSQILTMFVPQFSVFDQQFLITDVSIVWKTTMENNVEVVQPFYSVTATSGPVVGDYTRWLSNIIKGVTG